MKELVEYIVKQIVSMPDAVSVEESTLGSEVTLKLRVAEVDMGMVIGKKGQTIKALRRLLSVRAMNDGARVNLVLVDENRGVDTLESNEEAGESAPEVDENKEVPES